MVDLEVVPDGGQALEPRERGQRVVVVEADVLADGPSQMGWSALELGDALCGQRGGFFQADVEVLRGIGGQDHAHPLFIALFSGQDTDSIRPA